MHNLEYEPLGQIHSPHLLDLWGDSDVIRFTNIKAPCTFEQVKDRVTVLSSSPVFAVYTEGQIAGVVGCLCVDENIPEYGFFYHFKKAFWNQGIATQAAGWLLDDMKEKAPSAVFCSDVVANNVASEKILNRLGFEFVSQEENAFECDGATMTVRHYQKRN